MSIILLALVFTCTTLLGCLKAAQLNTRRHTLKDCQHFFRLLHREMSYHQKLIDDHLLEYSHHYRGRFSSFIADVIHQEGTFHHRFSKTLRQYQGVLALTRSDLVILEEFSRTIGTVSMDIQMAHLKFLIDYFEIEYQTLLKKVDQKLHLYVLTGMLIGGMCVILLW